MFTKNPKISEPKFPHQTKKRQHIKSKTVNDVKTKNKDESSPFHPKMPYLELTSITKRHQTTSPSNNPKRKLDRSWMNEASHHSSNGTVHVDYDHSDSNRHSSHQVRVDNDANSDHVVYDEEDEEEEKAEMARSKGNVYCADSDSDAYTTMSTLPFPNTAVFGARNTQMATIGIIRGSIRIIIKVMNLR